MGKGIVKLGEGNWAVKDGNLLAAKETNGRFKNAEFTVTRGTRATYVGRDGLIKESNLQDVNLVNNGDFEELGDELVTNGTFDTDSDWSLTRATISGGTANLSTTGGSLTSVVQSVTTVGNRYYFSIEVSDLVGELEFSAVGGLGVYSTITSNGTHTGYFTSAHASIEIKRKFGIANVSATIDNVSVKEVDPNDYWTLGTGWSIGDGKASFDGSQAISNLYQTVSTFTNKTFLVEGNASNVSQGFAYISLGGSDLQIVVNSSGSFKHYVTISSGNDILYISARSNFIGSIDNISVQEVKTDTPRIDFTDNTDGHLLLEPESRNLVTYSENFSSWTTTGTADVTPNTSISPDGTQTASTLSIAPSTFFYKTISTGSGTFTLSCYVKVLSGTNDFKMQSFSGTDGADASSVFTATTEWQRFEHTVTVSVDSNFYPVFISSPLTGGDFQIWGAQLEELSYPTSYIPTNGSTVTRDAETCTGAGETVDFNSEEGVLYAEIAGLVDADTYDRIISLSDNTTTNRVEMQLSSSGSIKGRFDSASSDITLTEAGLTASNFNKIALVWSSGKCALFINGIKEQEDLTFSTFASNVLFDLSFKSPYNDADGSRDFYGKCKAIRVYKEALSDTDLQNLTS